MSVLAIAGLAAALQGAPAAPPQAVHLVRSLYDQKLTPTHVEGVFARDLARAYRADISHPGEVGEIDFDWRYGAQDVEITELKVEPVHLKPGSMPMADRALVSATFKNLGKAYEVDYRLCKAKDGGWRIADVSSHAAGEAWDLRDLLKLGRVRVRC